MEIWNKFSRYYDESVNEVVQRIKSDPKFSPHHARDALCDEVHHASRALVKLMQELERRIESLEEKNKS